MLFLVPHEGYFHITFIFGEKAVDVILAGEFPDSIKQELLAAKKYAEGRGIRLDINSEDDFKQVLALIKVKLGK